MACGHGRSASRSDQSAIDRLQSAAYELVVEGESYRTSEAAAGAAVPLTDRGEAQHYLIAGPR